MLSRRAFLYGVGALPGLRAGGAAAQADAGPADPGPSDAVWQGWRDGLEAMRAEVLRRRWTPSPFSIGAPATEAEVARLEAEHRVAVPPQLRAVLTTRSARVGFGWSIPPLMRPLDGLDLPTSGGLRDALWDLAHIDGRALGAFESLKRELAHETDAEQPNAPEMWDGQFAFASLDNGDLLTIDASRPGGPQPVRYFSSDLEGLHGRILADDFHGFVTAYVALGCAGTDQDDWFRFVQDRDGRAVLDPGGPGGRRWRAWLARDPDARGPDEPPPAVKAVSRSDFALLDAAAAGSRWGIEAALASGASPDCVEGDQPNHKGTYDITFDTALILSLRRGDLSAVDVLLAAGATLDTRRLSVGEAATSGTVDSLRWLLARGARANGWAGDRLWPLQLLLNRSAAQHPGEHWDVLPMLDALLAGGADPNIRTADGGTALMRAAEGPTRVLLEHGADPKLYDDDGDTPLHLAGTAEKVRLLAAHGADVDALTRPPPDRAGSVVAAPHTPYQAQRRAGGDEREAVLAALVAAGADPLKRDGAGRSTLWYCHAVEDVREMAALGLDPRERDRDGATLLFEVVRWFGTGLSKNARATDLFAVLQGFGVDIDAADRSGTTLLHVAATRCGLDDLRYLLARGADPSLRDGAGRRPSDLVPAGKPTLRALLAGTPLRPNNASADPDRALHGR